MRCIKSIDNSLLTIAKTELLLLQVQYDFNRNKYFDAESAREYGIIDKVLKPPRKKLTATPK